MRLTPFGGSLENKGKYLISHTQRPAYFLCRNGIYFFHLFLLRGRSSARTVDKTDERTDPVGVRAIMLRAVARCPYVGGGTELLALNAQIAPITISKYTLHFSVWLYSDTKV